MAEDTEDSTPREYATTDEVSAVAGVERGSLGEWVRAGLLPAPNWTGGRGVIAKWPRSALKIAAFVRSQRELGFGLQDIRARIVAAFVTPGSRMQPTCGGCLRPGRRGRDWPSSLHACEVSTIRRRRQNSSRQARW